MSTITCAACAATNLASVLSCASCGAALGASSTTHHLPRGTRLKGGAFAVGEVLGQGGFGITYRGGDVALRRYVAIKEFFPQHGVRRGTTLHLPASTSGDSHSRALQGFQAEAQALSRFNHSGIVRVFEVFEENGTAYMIMELLPGATLKQRLDAEGTLPLAQVLELAEQMAGALGELHGAKWLHRDIKPDNIMAHEGRAVLIDFGSARELVAQDQAQARRTTPVLTPGYAPLEQYAQQARRGPHSDIYALGATLYHCLAGQAPIPATDRAADVHLPDLRELNPDVPAPIAHAIMRALELEAERRPQSAHEFLELLKRQDVPASTPASPSQSGMPQDVPLATEAGFVMHAKLSRHIMGVNALAWSPDAQMLASTGQDRMVYTWHPRMNTVSRTFTGHSLAALCCAFSPDGAWLASGGLGGEVLVHDIESRQILFQLRGHASGVRSLSFSPTHRLLATASEDGVCLWNSGSGTMERRLEVAATAVAFSHDGAHLAVSSPDGQVAVWEAAAWQRAGSWQAHEGSVLSLSWSPQQVLATSGEDGSVRLWQCVSGECLHILTSNPLAMHAVSFSHDGSLVAAGGDSDTVRVWSTRSGQTLCHHRQHNRSVRAVAFSPGSMALASGSRDRLINLCRCNAQISAD